MPASAGPLHLRFAKSIAMYQIICHVSPARLKLQHALHYLLCPGIPNTPHPMWSLDGRLPSVLTLSPSSRYSGSPGTFVPFHDLSLAVSTIPELTPSYQIQSAPSTLITVINKYTKMAKRLVNTHAAIQLEAKQALGPAPPDHDDIRKDGSTLPSLMTACAQYSIAVLLVLSFLVVATRYAEP